MSVTSGVERLRSRWRLRRERNLQRDAWRDAVSGLRGQLYLDRAGGPENTTFLAGHDRSGTTWIAEIVAHGGGTRYIFEPFARGRLDITAGFAPRQYVRPGDHDPRFRGPAEAIVTGRVRSVWTDKYNRAVLPRRRLVKEVRANLLLPWLHGVFPSMRVVFVLRHPCAVANSRMSVSSNWTADVDRFLRQDDLVQDHLGPIRRAIEEAKDEFERHVAVWCMDNIVPLRGLTGDRTHLLFYEDVCLQPEQEIRRLTSFLGTPFDPAVLQIVGRPSATARRDSPVVSGQSLVDGWRRSITPAQVDAAMRILEAFGLDRVYGRDSLPVSRPSLPV